MNRFHDALHPKIHENWSEAARGRALRNVNGRREEIKGPQSKITGGRGEGGGERGCGKGIYAVKEKCRRTTLKRDEKRRRWRSGVF